METKETTMNATQELVGKTIQSVEITEDGDCIIILNGARIYCDPDRVYVDQESNHA